MAGLLGELAVSGFAGDSAAVDLVAQGRLVDRIRDPTYESAGDMRLASLIAIVGAASRTATIGALEWER